MSSILKNTTLTFYRDIVTRTADIGLISTGLPFAMKVLLPVSKIRKTKVRVNKKKKFNQAPTVPLCLTMRVARVDVNTRAGQVFPPRVAVFISRESTENVFQSQQDANLHTTQLNIQ